MARITLEQLLREVTEEKLRIFIQRNQPGKFDIGVLSSYINKNCDAKLIILRVEPQQLLSLKTIALRAVLRPLKSIEQVETLQIPNMFKQDLTVMFRRRAGLVAHWY